MGKLEHITTLLLLLSIAFLFDACGTTEQKHTETKPLSVVTIMKVLNVDDKTMVVIGGKEYFTTKTSYHTVAGLYRVGDKKCIVDINDICRTLTPLQTPQ